MPRLFMHLQFKILILDLRPVFIALKLLKKSAGASDQGKPLKVFAR